MPACIHTHGGGGVGEERERERETMKKKGGGRKREREKLGEVQLASVKFALKVLQSTVPGKGVGYRINPPPSST